MISKTGVPSKEMVLSVFPKLEVLVKPKAVIECYQDIPCNPCETSCPFHAIAIGDNINAQPILNPNLCTGCGICIHSCPGLAITVVSVFNDKAIFKIPYELLPVPKVNEVWDAIDRKGDIIGKGHIENVLQASKQDKTLVITVSVLKTLLYDFITIRCANE